MVHPPAWEKMVAISKVLQSPELLEAGEYSYLRDSLWLTQSLLSRFDEMPANVLNEIGADKVDEWKKACGRIIFGIYSAYERRIHWQEEPAKEAAQDHRKSKC